MFDARSACEDTAGQALIGVSGPDSAMKPISEPGIPSCLCHIRTPVGRWGGCMHGCPGLEWRSSEWNCREESEANWRPDACPPHLCWLEGLPTTSSALEVVRPTADGHVEACKSLMNPASTSLRCDQTELPVTASSIDELKKGDAGLLLLLIGRIMPAVRHIIFSTTNR